MTDEVRVFAPATVANLGPGFDVLGLAVDGLGDEVTARRIDGPAGVELVEMTGDGGRLPREVDRNTATVAANSVAQRLGVRISLSVHKGLPLCSGLGSSAASSVAGAVAAALAAGVDVDSDRNLLLLDALAGERVASGAEHADNAAPSLFGGCVLLHGPHDRPPSYVNVPLPEDLWVVLALPKLELPTAKARAALPAAIPMHRAVAQWGRVAGVVAAFHSSNWALLKASLKDDIVEPIRGRLIPGFDAVKAAALNEGALASSISGAGPTVFALTNDQDVARRVGTTMVAAWADVGVEARMHVAQPDRRGARQI